MEINVKYLLSKYAYKTLANSLGWKLIKSIKVDDIEHINLNNIDITNLSKTSSENLYKLLSQTKESLIRKGIKYIIIYKL